MKKENLNFFKNLLIERKSNLMNEAKETMFGMTDDKKHFLIQTTGRLRKVTVTGCCVSGIESGSLSQK